MVISAAETLGDDKIWCRSIAVAARSQVTDIYKSVLCSGEEIMQQWQCAALQYLELYWGGEELLFRRDSRALEGAGVAPGAPGAADLERVLLLRGDITV